MRAIIRANKDKDIDIKHKAECRKGRTIMLLLLLMLSDWMEIRRIDKELAAIKNDQWWK